VEEISTLNNRTNPYSSLLGNSRRANRLEKCLVFYAVGATTVAMQSFGKHVPTIERLFSVWSVRKLYNDRDRTDWSSSVSV
jgi:hypothetical protein